MALAPFGFNTAAMDPFGAAGFADPFGLGTAGFGGMMMDPFAGFGMMGPAGSRVGGRDLVLPAGGTMVAGGRYPMDIVETGNAYEIYADTPGMRPDEISVDVDGDVLTVRGAHTESKRDTDASGRVYRTERVRRSFARSFTLPDDADPDGVAANMEHGVLTVNVPKREGSRRMPKRIAVGGGAAAGERETVGVSAGAGTAGTTGTPTTGGRTTGGRSK